MSSKKKKFSRKTIRKSRYYHNPSILVLGLYGKLIQTKYIKGWCKLHECYVCSFDLKHRHCDWQNCKHYLKTNKPL